MEVSGVRAEFLGAVSGGAAAAEGHRTISQECGDAALGRHQPESSGAPGRDWQRYGGAMVSGGTTATGRRTEWSQLPAGAGYRRAFFHTAKGIRDHLL